MMHKNPVVFQPASGRDGAFQVTSSYPFSGMILHIKHCSRKSSIDLMG